MIVCEIRDLGVFDGLDDGRVFTDEFSSGVVDENCRFACRRHYFFDTFAITVKVILSDGRVGRVFDLDLFILAIVGKGATFGVGSDIAGCVVRPALARRHPVVRGVEFGIKNLSICVTHHRLATVQTTLRQSRRQALLGGIIIKYEGPTPKKRKI
jgi:hypothetical protein